MQAMESRVERVVLHGEVTLDIEALAEYSGQGVCRTVMLQWPDTMARYRQELVTWARSRNWRVDSDNDSHCAVTQI